ncbi:MAG: Fe-S protein assembly co-chaperone HscB [Pseudomonadota bacterium]|nr:Fe-S protein assembly co-chaperone HscB [Pseudomonadota bacterium]
MLEFSKNFFELFGLPVAYGVDAGLLSERYRALQRALHPDRFAAAGAREKRLSMQASTRINEAFHTLKDPLSRARYLLSLHTGVAGVESETTKDAAFLMEQMELREALAQAKGRPDPYAAVGGVLDQLAVQERGLLERLEVHLDSPSAEDLEEVRELVRKLQFVYKCRAEAEQIEADLDDAL